MTWHYIPRWTRLLLQSPKKFLVLTTSSAKESWSDFSGVSRWTKETLLQSCFTLAVFVPGLLTSRDLCPSLRPLLSQPCSSVGVVVVREEVAIFFFHSFNIHPQIQLVAQKKAHSKKIYHTIICNYTKLHKWFCGTFLIFWLSETRCFSCCLVLLF